MELIHLSILNESFLSYLASEKEDSTIRKIPAFTAKSLEETN
jgi:hypothetical protein